MLESLNYYIGMAENAISYIAQNISETKNIEEKKNMSQKSRERKLFKSFILHN